jgi:hypothetical protein
MDDTWVPIVALISIFGLPIGGWILIRVMQHRERMAMLQRGIVPPPEAFGSRRHRRGGMDWTPQPPPPPWNGPGVPPPYYNYEDPNSPQCLLRKGIITAAVGMALFIGLSFIGWDGSDTGAWRPGPWLLGGLIPLFVGVAQIGIALLSGAQIPGLRPPQAPPGSNVPPSYGNGRPFTSYPPPPQPGQPGPRFEELARPVPPPVDRS